MCELDRIECLQQPDEHERRLVIRELLAEADAWAGIEGEEDEGVRREVLVKPSVEEAVWIELGRYIIIGTLNLTFKAYSDCTGTHRQVPTNLSGDA